MVDLKGFEPSTS